MREPSPRLRVFGRGRWIAAAVVLLAAGAGIVLMVSGGWTRAGSALFRFGRVSMLELAPEFRVATSLPTDVRSLGAVSAAVKEDGWYSANYVGVVETTRTPDGYLHRAIAPPEGIARWNPTGLCVGPRVDELFIANYNGHDVLHVKLAGDGTMSLVRRLTDDLMQSPENVAYHEGVLYVADYDGGAILAFDTESGNRLWRTEVARAHGVCVLAGSIYATSLMTREVLKLEKTGRIVARAGVSGWRPGEFLWPTQIVPLQDGTLAVTDAHQGRITILKSDLTPLRSIGGLGAGTNALNFPYCVLVRPEGNYIFDTFKERVLRVDGYWRVTEEISLAPEHGVAIADADVSGVRRNAYCYPKLSARSAANMLGLTGISQAGLYGGYGGLVQQSIPFWRRITMDAPSEWGADQRSDLTDQWYMTWARRHATERGDVLVMGSPQLRRMWVIDARMGVLVASEDAGVAWREDAWRVGRLENAAALGEEVVAAAASKLATLTRQKAPSQVSQSGRNSELADPREGFVFTLARATNDGMIASVPAWDAIPATQLSDLLSDSSDVELSVPRLLALRQSDSSGVRDIHALVECTDDAGGSLSKLKDVIVWADWGVPCAENSIDLKVDQEGAMGRVTFSFSGVAPPGSLRVSAIDARGGVSPVSLRFRGDRVDVLVAQASNVQIHFSKNAPALRGFIVLGMAGAITETRVDRWMEELHSDEHCNSNRAGAAVRAWTKSGESLENATGLAAVFEKVTGSGGSARLIRDVNKKTVTLAYFDEQRSEWLLQNRKGGAVPLSDLRVLNEPAASLTDADLDYLAYPERYR